MPQAIGFQFFQAFTFLGDPMLSDIEIAQNAKMLKIKDIAKELGIDEEELIPYGHYKAKISQECIDRLESKEDGKLILVTAINPTPAGEGKTTTSVGLAEGMYKICLLYTSPSPRD